MLEIAALGHDGELKPAISGHGSLNGVVPNCLAAYCDLGLFFVSFSAFFFDFLLRVFLGSSFDAPCWISSASQSWDEASDSAYRHQAYPGNSPGPLSQQVLVHR